EDVIAVAEHAMCIQRDHGNRKDRAHARFKYTIEDHGVAWVRAELERRLGHALGDARPVAFVTSADAPGWTLGADGRWHFTVTVQNGRLADRPGRPHLRGMRAIAGVHQRVFALATNQSVIRAGTGAAGRPRGQAVLGAHALVEPVRPRLRESAMACVAFPTGGLAM